MLWYQELNEENGIVNMSVQFCVHAVDAVYNFKLSFYASMPHNACCFCPVRESVPSVPAFQTLLPRYPWNSTLVGP